MRLTRTALPPKHQGGTICVGRRSHRSSGTMGCGLNSAIPGFGPWTTTARFNTPTLSGGPSCWVGRSDGPVIALRISWLRPAWRNLFLFFFHSTARVLHPHHALGFGPCRAIHSFQINRVAHHPVLSPSPFPPSTLSPHYTRAYSTQRWWFMFIGDGAIKTDWHSLPCARLPERWGLCLHQSQSLLALHAPQATKSPTHSVRTLRSQVLPSSRWDPLGTSSGRMSDRLERRQKS